MKQFNTVVHDVDFAIDGDKFHPPTEMPAELWRDLFRRYRSLQGASGDEQFDVMLELFEMVLPEDEFAVFSSRLRDKTKPIGLPMLADVVEWLVGEYGMAPTPSPSSSPKPSAATAGPASTGGARPKRSTPRTSRRRAT